MEIKRETKLERDPAVSLGGVTSSWAPGAFAEPRKRDEVESSEARGGGRPHAASTQRSGKRSQCGETEASVGCSASPEPAVREVAGHSSGLAHL